MSGSFERFECCQDSNDTMAVVTLHEDPKLVDALVVGPPRISFAFEQRAAKGSDLAQHLSVHLPDEDVIRLIVWLCRHLYAKHKLVALLCQQIGMLMFDEGAKLHELRHRRDAGPEEEIR